MSYTSDKPISLVQAARAVHGTRSPSEEQIDRVFRLMKSGTLSASDAGRDRLKWTTTESALADFMARRQIKRSRQPSVGIPSGNGQGCDTPSRTGRQVDSEELRQVYRGIWRDYFLAVMLRQRMEPRSRQFRRAVVAGQTALLLALGILLLGSVSSIGWLTPVPPEHQATMDWIRTHTDDYKITRWYPSEPQADGETLVVAVEYRYRYKSQRWIETERTFQVQGDRVTELQLED